MGHAFYHRLPETAAKEMKNPGQISEALASIHHPFRRVTKALSQNLQELRHVIEHIRTKAA